MNKDKGIKLLLDMIEKTNDTQLANMIIKDYAETIQQFEVKIDFPSKILSKIDNDEVIATSELRTIWESLELQCNNSGTPIKNEFNILKIFKSDDFFSDSVYYDKFQRCIFVKDPEDKKFRRFRDADAGTILVNLQSQFGLANCGLSMVFNAVEIFSMQNQKDELREYLTGVEWDGVERVGTFFIEYCGSKDTEYGRAVSLNWWVSLVARGLRPGCKVDNMVILEGEQGLMKSTMLAIIGGKWYAENTAEIGDKDFYQNLEGVLIAEIAELDSFSKAGVTTIKRVLTSVKDKYRPSYGRNSIVFERRNIFVGTTNEREYLKDETGNRRFWPIKCRNIKIHKVKEDRDQLFAEAVMLYRAKTPWWEVPDSAIGIQESRRQADPWEDVIRNWTDGRFSFTTNDLMTQGLNISAEHFHKGNSNRVGKIVRKLGFKYVVRSNSRVWEKLIKDKKDAASYNNSIEKMS